MSLGLQCPFKGCLKLCNSRSGLTQHINTFHHQHRHLRALNSSKTPKKALRRWTHPFLTARPCDENGYYLLPGSCALARQPLDATPENPFSPFPDRLAFEFADFHFSNLQCSEAAVNTALQLWKAQAAKHGSENVPWDSADEMYATIDQIQQGGNPWRAVQFRYSGPLPQHPPKWMSGTFSLVTRDIRHLLHEQIACSDFDGHWDYVPYKDFDDAGDRIWTNLMSGDWAAKQADEISKDLITHGAMFVSVVSGSDKTVASVATGHQEFHPVYIGPGNISNPMRRAHGIGILPCAFLPIPKASQKVRKTIAYQQFCRQLYHACLAFIYTPLKPAMMTPEIVQCPDGHFRHVIYSIGPYIADYPEQVWLAGIVQNWCPKCDAQPDNLDDFRAHLRTHEKTDLLLDLFDAGVIWDEYGLRSDVVPFTHEFPRADIHELITPDLLHQLIKGIFKDHLVTWVQDYLIITHGKTRALSIIQDIDRRISAVPAYAGLRRFPDGRDFNQWTGDDSKALMKVYIAAISGHVPQEMVRCIAAFMNCCYIVRRNVITSKDIACFRASLEDFHQLRQIFITTGVRKDVSLPRQHSLMHYPDGIELFGSPNGTCSSQTEARHIKAVKDPWRRSNRNQPLLQMLQTITQMEKLTALRRVFRQRGMLVGTVAEYTAACFAGHAPPILSWKGLSTDEDDVAAGSDEERDMGPVSGPKSDTDIWLAVRHQRLYPTDLTSLAEFISQPDFPDALHRFIHQLNHPNSDGAAGVDNSFNGPIHVYHSATAQFYAPSDLCGAGGMYREVIRANPNYSGSSRFDTVLVSVGGEEEDMRGLLVARIWLLFSYFDPYQAKNIPCALVTWFIHPTKPAERDPDTSMWKLCPEYNENGVQPMQVIHLDTVLRGAHLLPCYGEGYLPENFVYTDALDAFDTYFVNQFIDYHAHELLA